MRIAPTFAALALSSAALVASEGVAGQIICDFNSNLERSSLHTTIMGVPGHEPDWMAQSLAVQSIEGQGPVAEVMVSLFHWQGQRAVGVSVVAAQGTQTDGDLTGLIRVGGAEVVRSPMELHAFPSGHYPRMAFGYEAGTDAPFEMDDTARDLMVALAEGGGDVTLVVRSAMGEASYEFDAEALRTGFGWLLGAGPDYIARFHGGCPDAVYGRAG